MSADIAGFARRVIAWQRRHGRQHLPWQATRDPYRVWLSEIMLQQTQVGTVLAYYERFLARFPDVTALAAAPVEEVMGLWSGLGYYSRARHLHRCAQQVVQRFGGHFPPSAAELQTLPGIGRSTAAAIAAFCFGERAAILDGNVKRVLSRCFGIAGDPASAQTVRQLWLLAESLLPTDDQPDAMPSYTQGLMDLGATLCTQRNPACPACPLLSQCVAAREQAIDRYPAKRSRKPRERIELWLLHAHHGGATWLEPRPAPGIWAGLQCLPAFASRAALLQVLSAAERDRMIEHPPSKHILTHRELHLNIVSVAWESAAPLKGRAGRWHGALAWREQGLPAPIRRFLQRVGATDPASVEQFPMAQQRLPLS